VRHSCHGSYRPRYARAYRGRPRRWYAGARVRKRAATQASVLLAPDPDPGGQPAPRRRRRGGGSLCGLAPSLGVVATSAAENFDRQRTQWLLEWLLRNGRREKLCAEVAKLTAAPHALVEDALQEVCLKASRRGDCRGQSAGEVYNWLRSATVNRVRDELKGGFERYEVPVDWAVEQRQRHDTSAGADAEVLDRERQRELGELVQTALAELDEPQRKVAVLHAYGAKGPEIARQLHVSRKRVARLKEQMLAGARDALAAHAGAGCDHGDSLVRRLAFGLADPREHAEAELHMASCAPCAAVYRRLELWHDKVAALAPVPAAAHDPGLVERTLHKTADALASLKQHATEAGTQAKQQLADAAGQAKQHAAAGYTRAAEYTPIASVRPGAAAAAIAGCLAVGGGAAGYCIDRGVDPITGLVDVVQPSPAKPAQEPPEQKPPGEQPPDPPQLPTSAPTPPTPEPEPEPTPPTTAPEQPAAAPAPAPAEPAPPPPPPPEPTPPAIQFGEPATPAQSIPSTPAPSPQPAQPAPAPSGGTNLYGP
jgi:RNA polymerase sigma factor (sigma-70 family)